MDRAQGSKWLLVISACATVAVYAHLYFPVREKPPKPTEQQLKRFNQVKDRAEKGDVNAQARLGSLYENARGVAPNKSEASKWYNKAVDQYRKSAEKGDAEAQRKLGEMYQNGSGVKRDLSEAAKFYLKAAEQGNARAQYELGLMYNAGVGVRQDYAEAYKWYTLAAAYGAKEAAKSCEMLARHMTEEQITDGEQRAADFAPKKN